MLLIRKIQTIAWYHAVADEAGAKSAYELGRVIDELRIAAGEHDALETKSFSPYASGLVVPSEATLDLVERVLPSTKLVFQLGPKSDSAYSPLWLALGGSEQAVRSVLVWYDKELGKKQASGASLSHLVLHVTQSLMPERMVMDNLIEAWRNPEDHLFANAYREGLKVNLDQVTVIVALWRLSMMQNDEFPFMHYFVTGLNQQAIPDLLGPYGVDQLFIETCRMFQEQHFKYLRDLERGALSDAP